MVSRRSSASTDAAGLAVLKGTGSGFWAAVLIGLLLPGSDTTRKATATEVNAIEGPEQLRGEGVCARRPA
jgi:hypothetical protein